MLKISRIFILFFISLNLCASEVKLLGTARLDSLMGLTEDAGRLAERVSPGSSLLLVMGLTAFTFDSKYKDFDLTAPISLYLYSVEGDNKESTEEWCAVFKKKGTTLPKSIKYGNETAFLKEINGNAVFSFSKKLIDSISSLPECKDEKKQLFISLSVAEYLKCCKSTFPELKKELMKSLLNSRSVPENTDISSLKSLQVKLDYAEAALRQIERLDISLSFTQDGISMKMSLAPSKNSALEKFISVQHSHDKKLAPLFSEKMITASGSLAVTEEMKNALIAMIKDIALETADDERRMEYSELLSFAVKNSSGSFSYYSDIDGGLPLSYFKLFCGNPQSRDFMKRVSKYADMKTENSGLYKLYSFKAMGKPMSLFSYIEDRDIVFLNGSIENKDAMGLIDEKCQLTAVPEKYSGCSFVLMDNSVCEAASEIVLFFRKDGIAADVNISSETVKNYIPKEFLKKGNKKGGRKGIKIKSGEFSD
ncbi:MAG: hypothetical protein A2017_05625 [Lentisphaerae bacterium GWF2_44_16]|nr:MAG: hypothetical protein A2017_05625 [Lentisphaerae bacterium GWF2_44_16]